MTKKLKSDAQVIEDLRAEVERLKKIAVRTYREFVCPKCLTEFEDDGKPHPAGILCPECRQRKYAVVGVIHPKTITTHLIQQDWDDLIKLVGAYRKNLRRCWGDYMSLDSDMDAYVLKHEDDTIDTGLKGAE